MSIGIAIGTSLGGTGLGSVTMASDTFTDVDGTSLTSHVPTSGGSWTRHATGSTGAGDPIIDGGRIHNQNDASQRISYITALSIKDCVISADVVMRSDNNLSFAGLYGRMNTSQVTFYHVRYHTNGNVWRLYKYVNNTPTQLGSGDIIQTLTVDQAYRCELRMWGSTISVAVDGVVILTAVDTSIAVPGFCGVGVASTGTPTAGVHLDNLLVRT